MIKRKRYVTLFASLLLAASVFTGCAATSGKSRLTTPSTIVEEGVTLSQQGNYESAIEKFLEIIDSYPLSREAVEAQLLLADTYYEKGDYEDGAAYYTDFATLHPSHPKASYAQFKKGMSYLKQTLSIDRDPAATKKAILAFDDLTAYYPVSIYSDKARELRLFLKNRLAEREYMIGAFYFKKKNYRAALRRFLPILHDYPGAEITPAVLFHSAISYTETGEKRQAEETLMNLIDNYPDSSFTGRARRLMKNSG
ncbi:MAG: outer membrane protein assembly factor BamD [Thermodesulfobacteriota bacterium]